jgi:hypothetical protein
MTVPGNLSSPLLATAAAAAAADAGPIKSLRFNGGDSAYLSRTPSSAGNRKTWTFSTWCKMAKPGEAEIIFNAQNGTTQNFANNFWILFNSNVLVIGDGSADFLYSQTLRDPSAWYHIVVACDTTQSSASDRLKIYINGVEAAYTGNYIASNISQNSDTAVNSTYLHRIGDSGSYHAYLDGYLTDTYLIDGSALTPSSFGAFDDSGVWQAAAYSGTFGTNGFHLLDFANESTVGHDSSGNENDYTANNIVGSITNYSNDISIDSGNFYLDGRSGRFGFDGSSSTYIDCRLGSGSNSTTNIIWTPTGGIAGVTKIEVNSNYATHYRINEGTWTSFTSNGSTVQIYSGSSFTLTKLEIRRNNNAGSDYGHRVTFYEINDVQYQEDDSSTLDVLFDVPTNGTQSDTGAGGEVSANYPTWNPLDNGGVTLANGNLDASHNAGNHKACRATVKFPESGKWYYEATITTLGSAVCIGLDTSGAANPNLATSGANFILVNSGNSVQRYLGSGFTDFSSAFGNPSVGSILQVAYDADADKLWLGMNNVWMGSGSSANGNPGAGSEASASSITSGFPVLDLEGTSALAVNFGQKSWAYSAPSGFKALCTTNLPTPTIADGSAHFQAKKYDGTGATQSITTTGMSPDWVWIKRRSAAKDHSVFDTVRGTLLELFTNETSAENTKAGSVTSFNSDGFTLGNSNRQNENGYTNIAWCWNAGANSNKTYTVTVVSDSGNKYRFDGHGTSAVTLDLAEGSTYIFDQSDSSNSGHPLRFSTTSNGSHGGGSEYTTGVTATGTPGSAGAKTTIVVASGAPTLYYYCTAHSGMGGQINTNSTAGSTRLSGSIESLNAYNQGDVYSDDLSAAYDSEEQNAFDGNLSTTAAGAAAGAGITWTPAGGLSYSSKVRAYTSYTTYNNVVASFSLNGGTAVPTNSAGWYTLATGSGTITSISHSYTQSYRGGINAIEVDGKILVDSSVTLTAIPSINSVVKANPEAGFSVGTFTGTGATGTVATGLTDTKVLILKNRDSSSNWVVYHTLVDGSYDYMYLNLTNANASSSLAPFTMNDTFKVSFNADTNASGDDYSFIAFEPVKGFSSFGTYVGNGSADGPFVYTGFRPALILGKRSDATNGWFIFDSARDGYNVADAYLAANADAAEASYTFADFLSNGFKLRGTTGDWNGSSGTILYMAFAENPFQANGGLAR